MEFFYLPCITYITCAGLKGLNISLYLTFQNLFMSSVSYVNIRLINSVKTDILSAVVSTRRVFPGTVVSLFFDVTGTFNLYVPVPVAARSKA